VPAARRTRVVRRRGGRACTVSAQRLEVDDVARLVGDRRQLEQLGQGLGAADVGDELGDVAALLQLLGVLLRGSSGCAGPAP
jgi:hypothetical protein